MTMQRTQEKVLPKRLGGRAIARIAKLLHSSVMTSALRVISKAKRPSAIGFQFAMPRVCELVDAVRLVLVNREAKPWKEY